MKTTEEKILSLIKVIIAWTQRHCPEIVEDEVNLSLAYLSQEGHLIHIGNDYAITETRYAENQAVKLIAELIKHNVPPCEIDVVAAMALAEEGLGFNPLCQPIRGRTWRYDPPGRYHHRQAGNGQGNSSSSSVRCV